MEVTQVTTESRQAIDDQPLARGGASGHDASAASGHAPAELPVARLSVPLGAGETLRVCEDRVLAGGCEYPYDDWFGARLVPDPRAPLTVRPTWAVALVTHGGFWDTFVPQDELAAIQVLAAIRDACQRRGIEPIGIDDSVQLPELPQPAQQAPSLLFQWPAPEQPSATSRESWLLTLVRRLATAVPAFRTLHTGR
jgi:hypothetical protein